MELCHLGNLQGAETWRSQACFELTMISLFDREQVFEILDKIVGLNFHSSLHLHQYQTNLSCDLDGVHYA